MTLIVVFAPSGDIQLVGFDCSMAVMADPQAVARVISLPRPPEGIVPVFEPVVGNGVGESPGMAVATWVLMPDKV